MLKDKEVRKIIFDIIYTAVITIALSILWWGPYQNSIRVKESLQGKVLNQTNELITSGLDFVAVKTEKTIKDITIANKSDKITSYTISFMVEKGKMQQDTNQNNYVLYSIIDERGNMSEARNLSLDGYMLTSQLAAGQEKKYTIILWSEMNNLNLDGSLALIANPVV